MPQASQGRTQAEIHGWGQSSYIDRVIVLRQNGYGRDEWVIQIDLGNDVATEAEILTWYCERYDIDPKGLRCVQAPKVIGFRQ